MDAQCKICGDTFKYSSNQVSLLAEHFCYDHGDLNVGYYTIANSSIFDQSEYDENADRYGKKRSKQSLLEKGSGSKERGGKRPYKNVELKGCAPCSCGSGDFNFDCRKSFKTTVECWSQGPHLINCPECGQTGAPLIRRQRNKIAKSSLGAFCLLGCWPLCFLPFMLGGSNLINLYCKNCGRYISTYDRHLGEVKSNKFEIVQVPNICN